MYAWYVQDDWKVTPQLSLNLGFRHELEFPITERYNRANRGFDFGAATGPDRRAGQLRSRAGERQLQNTLLAGLPASQYNVLGGLLFASNGARGLRN